MGIFLAGGYAVLAMAMLASDVGEGGNTVIMFFGLPGSLFALLLGSPVKSSSLPLFMAIGGTLSWYCVGAVIGLLFGPPKHDPPD